VLVQLDDLTPDQIYAFERHAFRAFYLRPAMVLPRLTYKLRQEPVLDTVTLAT